MKARSRARASCRRAIPSAPPAVIATSTFFPPSFESKSPVQRRQPGGRPQARARTAQIRRRGHQDLRDRRRLLAQHRTWSAAAHLRGDESHRRRGAHVGPEGRRPRARRHAASATPRSPASTRSSTPAWSTTKASPQPRRWAPTSRWTSTTPNTPRPKARRTACWRTISARTARSPRSSARTSARR